MISINTKYVLTNKFNHFFSEINAVNSIIITEDPKQAMLFDNKKMAKQFSQLLSTRYRFDFLIEPHITP